MSITESNLIAAVDMLCEGGKECGAAEVPASLIFEIGNALGLLWLEGRAVRGKLVVLAVEASELDTFGAGFLKTLKDSGAHVKLSCTWSEFIPQKIILDGPDETADYYVFATSNLSNMSAGAFVLSCLQANASDVSLACPVYVNLQHQQFSSNCMAYASANQFLAGWLALPHLAIVGAKLETDFEDTGVYDYAMKRCSATTEFFYQLRTSLYDHRWDALADQRSYENYIPALTTKMKLPVTWHWKQPSKQDEFRVKSSFGGAFYNWPGIAAVV